VEDSKDEPEDIATEDEDASELETAVAELSIDDDDIDGLLAALSRTFDRRDEVNDEDNHFEMLDAMVSYITSHQIRWNYIVDA
jgi:hypothetical protein